MKFPRIILFFIIISPTLLSAQERDLNGAIGGRSIIGWDAGFYGGGELSLQLNGKGIRRSEFDLGFAGGSSWDGFRFTYLYQWRLVRNKGFNFYTGLGPSFAMINEHGRSDLYVLSIAGNIGIDYTFGFPIQIALDWRPEVDIVSDLGEPIGYQAGIAFRLGF